MTDASVPLAISSPWQKFRRFRWAVIGILLTGLFFALLVPTMCRSSAVANRVKSSLNLRQLGLSLITYSADHNGHLPHDWADLILSGAELTPGVFVSPSSNDDWAQGKTPADWAPMLIDSTKHFCSYKYTGDGLSSDQAKDSKTILAFEPVDRNDGWGIHVLYGNGNVKWIALRNEGETKPRYQKFVSDAAQIRPLHLPE